ncbi:MAG: MarR family winged helix-turn-helix transcriptional regulator [Acidimicrobiales bacterium]
MRSTIRRRREPTDVRLARETHVNVLVAANRFSDEMERRCREGGVTHAQYVALWVLCLAEGADDGLPMGAIADGLLNRAPDTTRLVDRLEQAGLAERYHSPQDRRVVLVRATAAGHQLFAVLTARVKEFHRSQWAALTRGELEQLDALLAKALWGTPAADAPDASAPAATGARP